MTRSLVICAAVALPMIANAQEPPGAINPAVTQANIYSTICRRGWAATIRPPVEYTEALKHRQLPPGVDLRRYQEDHRVPIGVGGAPYDERNLWPEPWQEALHKDKLEGEINARVCRGAMTLWEGQAIFLGDWRRYLQ